MCCALHNHALVRSLRAESDAHAVGFGPRPQGVLFKLPNTRFSSLSTRSSSSSSPRVLASVVPSTVPRVAEELVDYLNNSWTSFHATAESARLLIAAGYTRLSERDEWELKPGGKYFFTRNMSSVVAFAVGDKYEPGNGFNIIGAHTDSPCPKLKPVSAIKKGGFLNVGVQTYGGGLWHTWFDRDLSVAGRVLLRRGKVGAVHDDFPGGQHFDVKANAVHTPRIVVTNVARNDFLRRFVALRRGRRAALA